jgi:hypothetical protein
MNRTQAMALSLILGGAIFLVTAAYAANISLPSSSVMQIGGTGQVTVNCPANPCSISTVAWTINSPSNAAPTATGVQVTWTPAVGTGHTYTVYVTVYNSVPSVIATGSASQSTTGSAVTTSVPFGAAISTQNVYNVEIDIVQTA